jgi:hypothetical protein
MYVGIGGSREYPELQDVRDYVYGLDADDVVVSGGARGVDRCAEETAVECGLHVVSFRPFNTQMAVPRPWGIVRLMWQGNEWTRHMLPERYPSFAPAAFVRNGYIVELSDRVALFWDGRSRGTKDTLRKAEAKLTPSGVDLHRRVTA